MWWQRTPQKERQQNEPGVRLSAIKNVTADEEFVQGHFPGLPVVPGVLMIEALAQVAAMLVLDRPDAAPAARAALRGVSGAKFRRHCGPGGGGASSSASGYCWASSSPAAR